MIGFYTKFTTAEEDRDKLCVILGEAADAMNNVPDCKMYIVNTDSNDASVMWVTEMWTTKEAHVASLELPEAKALIAKAIPILKGTPEEITLTAIKGKGI